MGSDLPQRNINGDRARAISSLVEFGDLRFDLEKLILMRSGTLVRLPPKSLETLAALVRAYPEVMTREQLLAEVWPDVNVDESNLTQNVYTLRKALGTTPDGTNYVETVPKRGYRFTAEPIPVVDSEEVVLPPGPPQRSGGWMLGAAAVVVVMVTIGVYGFTRPREPEPGHPEAVALYERGRALTRQRRMDTAEAENCFRRAIKIDPAYEAAKIGLADVLITRPRGPQVDEAEQLIQGVLQRNPKSAEGRATAGFIAMMHRWNWKEAETHLNRSVELNPRYVWARQWRALYYGLLGRHDEALKELDAGLMTEPASINLLTEKCGALYHAGRPSEAAGYCRTALELDRRFVFAYSWLAKIYTQLNVPEEVIVAFSSLTGETEATPNLERRRLFSAAFQRGGLPGVWRQRLLETEADPAAYFRGEAQAFIGARHEAMEALERSVEQHSLFSVFLGVEPAFRELRGDPRFRKLCERVGVGQPQ